MLALDNNRQMNHDKDRTIRRPYQQQLRQAHTAPALSVSRSLQQLPPMRIQPQQCINDRNENNSSLSSLSSSMDNCNSMTFSGNDNDDG